MKKQFICLCFLGFGSLISALAFAKSSDIDKTFDILEGASVTINVKSGDVVIETWNKDQLRIVGEVYGDPSKLKIRNRGHEVHIVSHGKNSYWGGYGDNGAEFTVYAPQGVSFRVTGASTSFDFRDVASDVVANTMSGDIDLSGGVGKVSLESVSGSIQVKDAQGRLRLSTVSGDIEVQAEADRFVAQSVSGDIQAQIGDVNIAELKSVSGDIEIELGLLDDARFDASTVSGDIDIEFASKKMNAAFDIATGPGGDIVNRLTDDQPKSKFTFSGALDFQVGDGSATVDVETMSGTIRLDD